MKRCSKCDTDKPEIEFHLHSKDRLVRRSWCISCSVNSLREYRHTYKNAAVALLGNKCALCGETEREFLSIDHLDGGGVAERRRIGTNKIYKLIADGLVDLTGYRVLCRNCNDSLQMLNVKTNSPYWGLKLRAFDVLGNTCSCCKEDNILKLNMDGASLRKQGGHNGSSLHTRIVKGEPGFQLLCWNCNFSSFIGHGVCAHRRLVVT